MNSVERIMATIKFQKTDRPPAAPVQLLQGARLLNIGIPEYLQSAKNMAQGQIALVDKYDPDCVFGIPNVTEDVVPFGGDLYYFENGSPTIGKMAWRSWDDMENPQIQDPKGIEICTRTLNTINLLAKKYKGEKMIVGAVTAPFSLPSLLIGSEKWYELLWEDELIREPILKRVLDLTTNFCVKWANYQLQAGADAIVMADGMASATCIMREQFEQLALPNIISTIKAIDGPVIYEPIGYIQPFIDLMPTTGAVVVVLDCHDDVKTCRDAVHGKMAVMGNLNNIEMIRWTPEYTAEQCAKILELSRDGGVILSAQGPEVPWDVPGEVIQVIMDSARNWKN